jgi:hypothetical protein
VEANKMRWNDREDYEELEAEARELDAEDQAELVGEGEGDDTDEPASFAMLDDEDPGFDFERFMQRREWAEMTGWPMAA